VKVRERMNAAPIVCGADETLETVARRLWESGHRAMPVVDGRGALAGMVTDRDLALAALRRRARLDELRAADAMTGVGATCGPDDDLWFAAELMRTEGVRRLCVVGRERQPVGVITVADLARHAASGPARDLDDLGMDDVVELLVEIEDAEVEGRELVGHGAPVRRATGSVAAAPPRRDRAPALPGIAFAGVAPIGTPIGTRKDQRDAALAS
jgi:CBS domain-containing protein